MILRCRFLLTLFCSWLGGVYVSFVVCPHFFSASSYSNLVLLNISALKEFRDNLSLIIFVSCFLICGGWSDDTSIIHTKILLNLIEKNFPRSGKLHKIFNKTTVKVSYSCTQNMSQIIKGHNKRIIQKETQETLECNCRVKTECPLNGDCRKESVI